MKALTWQAARKVSVENVPDPKIEQDGDVIVKITSTAICGSDLHLYDGYVPMMKSGDVLGHEFMGEVIEVGKAVRKHKVGDRIIVPFTICCGRCTYCESDLWSLCDNTNPNGELLAKAYGSTSGAGLFGYSHLYGGYAGGQAEYARVPFADVAPMRVPPELPDEKVLFLTDIFPTGYMAAENANIKQGDTVVVFGCGPVGQFAIRSALMLGAERVIAIDRFNERLTMAQEGGAEVINYEDEDSTVAKVHELTQGKGGDAVIDAVGMEAHGTGLLSLYDDVKHALRMQTDNPTSLRSSIQCCRKGGTVSIPGVYTGVVDKFNIGAAFAKGLTFRMGQTHVPKYLDLLLEKVVENKIDPSFVITHTLPLEEAEKGYQIFRDKEEDCIKVILKP